MKKYDNFTQFLTDQEQLIIKPIIDEIIFNLKNDSNQIKASNDKWIELKSFFEELAKDYTDIKSIINKFLISGILADDPEIIKLIEQKKLINRIKPKVDVLLSFRGNEDKADIERFIAGFIADVDEHKNHKTSFDVIALAYAAKFNKSEIVDFFLNQIKKNNELVNCYNDLYCLVINEAIIAGNIDVVKHTISKYQIDAQLLLANEGVLAICNAINNSDLEIIKYLLTELHITSKSISDKGVSILRFIIAGEDLELYSYLIKNYDTSIFENEQLTNIPLNIAAIMGKQDIVRYEVEIRKVNPDSTDKLNITPLMCAIAENQLDLAKYLLATNKVNTNFRINGKPMINIAIKEGYVEMTALLLNDKNLVLNNKQKTQLFRSSYANKNLPITKLLIEKYGIAIAKGFDLKLNLKEQELITNPFELLFWSFIFFTEQLYNTHKNIVILSYKNPHIKHVLGGWHELDYTIKDNHQSNLSLKDGIDNVSKTLNSIVNFIKHILPEKIIKHIGNKFKDKLLAKIILAKMMLGEIIITEDDLKYSEGQLVAKHYISKWLCSEKDDIAVDKVTLGIFHNKLFHSFDHNASFLINYSDVQIPVFRPNQIQKEHFKNMHLFELRAVSKTMNINSNAEGLCEKLPPEIWYMIASYLELNDIIVPFLGEETSYII